MDRYPGNLPIAEQSYDCVEILTGTPRRRRWSGDEKARIVAESLSGITRGKLQACGLETFNTTNCTACKSTFLGCHTIAPILSAEDAVRQNCRRVRLCRRTWWGWHSAGAGGCDRAGVQEPRHMVSIQNDSSFNSRIAPERGGDAIRTDSEQPNSPPCFAHGNDSDEVRGPQTLIRQSGRSPNYGVKVCR
jgi:hypothetical protein